MIGPRDVSCNCLDVTITNHLQGFSTQVTTLSGQLTKPGFFFYFHQQTESNRGQRNIQLKYINKKCFSAISLHSIWHNYFQSLSLRLISLESQQWEELLISPMNYFSCSSASGGRGGAPQLLKKTTGSLCRVTGMLPHKPPLWGCINKASGRETPHSRISRKTPKSCTIVCIFPLTKSFN